MTARHRLLTLALAASLAVTATACGGDSSDGAGDAAPTSQAGTGNNSGSDPQVPASGSADDPAFEVGIDVAASSMARVLNATDHRADEDARTVDLRFDEGSQSDGSITCLSIVGLVDPDVTITLAYPDGDHTCER